MVNKIYEAILAGLGMHPDSYVDLEGISLLEEKDESTIFLRKSGTLVTIARMRGNFKILEGSERFQYWADVEEALRPLISGTGHQLQIVFSQDREGVRRRLTDITEPARMAMKRSGIDFSWLLDSRIDTLTRFCTDENIWLVIETDTSWMSKEMSKNAVEQRKEVNEGVAWPGRGVMSNFETIKVMYERHVSAVNNLRISLSKAGLVIDVMKAGDFLKDVRFLLEPHYSGRAFYPRLPGKGKPPSLSIYPSDIRYRLSHLLYPAIARQVITTDIEQADDHRIVKYGNRYYVSVLVTLMPEKIREFAELIDRLGEFDISYMASYRFRPSQPTSYMLKGVLAGFLTSFSQKNKQFRWAKMALDDYMKEDGEITSISIQFVAYGDSEEEALSASQKILQVLNNWGNCEGSDVSGDPSLGLISSLPALTSKEIAPIAVSPMPDAVRIAPLYRLSSPWLSGASLFRTETGKIMPYQPGSSLQSSWSSICFAPPGQGKSVLLNSLLLSMVMSSPDMPLIGVMDIGPSSRGLIDMLYHSLPENKRHLVTYMSVENDERFAINVFDTILGSDMPLPEQASAVVNFLVTLCTPEGASAPPDGVSNMLRELLPLLYEKYSRRSRDAKPFESMLDSDIAEFLEKKYPEILEKDGDISWWNVVDYLFDKSEVVMAQKAQRYAMPTIEDMMAFTGEQKFQDTYGKIDVNGQPLPQYIANALSAAIKSYRLVSGYTRFDVGNARIMAFDLQNVAPAGSEAAARQSAVVFSLFRFVITRDFYLSDKVIMNQPMEDRYRHYHLKRVEGLTAVPKVLCMDEFHRTQGVESFRATIVRDIREGRKFGVQILLFSQDADDFSKEMQEFSTTKFILGAGEGEDTVRKLKNAFALSDSAIKQIRRIGPPTSKGAQLYIKARTKLGEAEMMVYNSLGPVEMWALETNANNRRLRTLVYNRLGVRDGLMALARFFPRGSAVDYINKKQDELLLNGVEQDVFEYVADEVVSMWRDDKVE